MFVWTAVMQQVEEGKLDLRSDVNRYLHGVRIPDAFSEPVTLENLMTHTAGFEDRVIGLFAKTSATMRPLAEVIRTTMPARVFPPGKITAYSNYGTALAAQVVEQVSGIPFEQYLNQRILGPLGMQHSTLAQPLPSGLAPDMAKGYKWTANRLEEETFEYVPLAPCGGMSMAGEDMARFMMAHLADGALGSARILRPETARLMREPLIVYSPRVPGMLHGFMGFENNGVRAFGHGGDTVWFHSMTVMIPARNTGFFVAYNTDSGSAARSQFVNVFFDHYFPSPLPKEAPAPKNSRAALEKFAGTYYSARSSQSDYSGLNRLMGAVTASVNRDGYLVMAGSRWRQIEPLLFAEVDGRRRLAFRQDGSGNIIDACASPVCTAVLLKQPFWRTRGVEMGVAETCLAILVIALIGFPIAAVTQWREPRPRTAGLARLVAWLTWACFLAGLMVLFPALDATDDVVFGTPRAIRIVTSLWTLSAVCSLATLAFAGYSWREGWWRLPGRVSYSAVSIVAAAAALWLYHWNLVGLAR